MKQLFRPKGKMRVAAFMSGTGSNLIKILESEGNFEVVLVFTDNPESNAKKIADEHGIEYYCNDIKEFYKSKGADRKDLGVRKEFDREIAGILEEKKIDVIALCGYMSIVTEEVCGKFLTINVHPADLRILQGGKRKYAGCMGEGCVRKVIEDGGKELRSSTHIVTKEVDEGAVLMVSEPVKVDSENYGLLLEKLKEEGDWKVYPETIKRLADGRFWEDDGIAVDIVEEKELLRERMMKIRERMSDAEVKDKSAEITKKLLRLEAYTKAKTVMFYMGINREVHTEDAIKDAMATKTAAVPVTDLESGRIIPARIKSLEEMRPGAYGIPEPAEVEEVKADEIEMVIVPGLAFDADGNRIGYGLGFYDRFLKKVKGKKIALAYDWQVTDRIRAEERDERMDAIITDEQIIEVEK